MSLLVMAFLMATNFVQAQGLPMLADFDQGQFNALGGGITSQQARLSLSAASDYTLQGGSLSVESLGEGTTVLLPLAEDGLILERNSSSRSVIVIWKAEAVGTQCRVCLEGGNTAGELCASLQAADTAWHEVRLPLPPSDDPLAFRSARRQPMPLKAQALSLKPQAGSTWSFDEIRLDPPAEALPAAAVAAAFDSSPAQVRAARRLGLPELATWALLLLSNRSGLSPQALAAERRTRSWGEISKAHGADWGALMDEVALRRAQAGLGLPEPTLFQEHKLMENHAFDGVKP
jgi:hypothetical protein